MTDAIRILLVEGSQSDATLITQTLEAQWPQIVAVRVEDETTMRAALADHVWDVVICDWCLPKFNALGALQTLRDAELEIPFVVFSGVNDVAPAIESLRRGAHDYVLKADLDRLASVVDRELRDARVRRELEDHRREHARFFNLAFDMLCVSGFDGYLKRVNPAWQLALGWTAEELRARPWIELVHPDDKGASAIAEHRLRDVGSELVHFENRYRCKDGSYRYLLWSAVSFAGEKLIYAVARDITSRKESEVALAASEVKYRALFDNSPFSLWVYALGSLRFLAVNDSAIHQYGYSRDEFLAMRLDDIVSVEDLPKVHEFVERAALAGDQRQESVWRHRRKDQTMFDARVTSQPLAMGELPARLAVAEDITERRRLEEQLRQSQKMEAIGTLAGGIAHDFNNLLSVILSYTSLIRDDLKPGDLAFDDLGEVEKAAIRATRLTKQLLAFSRRQVLEPRVVEVNEIICGMGSMLRRLLHEDVELSVVAAPDTGRVLVDPGQLEQVLMNLAVNARDAMPRGGKLTIATSNVSLDEAHAQRSDGAKAGSHVMVTVTDNGMGMDERTCAQIFEPFFTTKEKDKGTGLGLSTVLGIVQQSGGHIEVESVLGRGTQFKMYFARTDDEIAMGAAIEVSTALKGVETILLVEDDEQVRTLATSILRRNGYGVLEAQNGGEALLVCEQHEEKIHLLVTDVVMKRMSGVQLAKRLAVLRPTMKTLFISGHIGDAAGRDCVKIGAPFLQKPITPPTLLRKVRDVLDAPEATTRQPRVKRKNAREEQKAR